MASRANLLASFVIVIIVFSAVGGALFLTTQYEPPKIAVVMVNPGLGDRSMADQTYEGIQRLSGDIVVETEIIIMDHDLLTQVGVTAAKEEISELARTGGYQIIVAVGQRLADIINEAAEQYPTVKFALIGGQSDLENVASSTFVPEEAAFLAGVIGALVASSRIVGTIRNNNTGNIAIMGARDDDPNVRSMIHGFIQGVQFANNSFLTFGAYKVRFVEAPFYIGSYDNVELANSTAYDYYINQDVSLIFAPVRASIVGIRQAMDKANETLGDPIVMPGNRTRAPLAIGAEANQDYYGNPNPDVFSGPSWITTSVVLRTDLAVYDIVNKTLWGEFNGTQNFRYDLANGGCNITEFEFSSTYMIAFYFTWMQMLVNGSIPYEVTYWSSDS
ncbi:MAG: BMP family ABC transporter substrate-binding protein [Candidatus Thorarchaeota archaeon]